MTEVLRPHIDKSRIKKEFWTIEPVTKVETWLQDLLVEPGHFDKLCAHEGAHLYYIRKIHPDARILPPAVYYHPKKLQFWPREAAIDFDGMNKTCDRDRLLVFAMGTFAGGVLEAVHLLGKKMPVDKILGEIGDSDDHEEFAGYCEEIRAASPGLIFDMDEIRRVATLKVFHDVSIPITKAELDASAQEVRTFLCAVMYPDKISPNVSTICDSYTQSKS